MLKKELTKRIAAALPLFIATSFMAVPAFAAKQATSIEEIVVTARKRQENAQETPVSITAFGSAQIEELNITDISDISDYTPNLIVTPNTGGSDGAAVCMRGLCRTDFTITEDPMVGVYLDGVYIGKSVGSLFDVAELESIQVLRGPQGTLYGKNTLGGAVLLETRKPTGKFVSKAALTGGNYDALDLKAYMSFPVVEGLAASVSYLNKQRDPFVENENAAGGNGWDEDNSSALVQLRATPNQALTVDYSGNWQEKRQLPLLPQLTSAEGSLGGFGLGDLFAADALPDYSDKLNSFGDTFSDTDSFGHAVNVSYNFGDVGAIDNLIFKSISSYRDVGSKWGENATGTSSAFLVSSDTLDLRTTSQEFQLSGSNESFDFVSGFYYYNEQGDYTNGQEINAFVVDAFHETSLETTAYALYGEFTYHITEEFSTSLGVRSTQEERDASHRSTTFVGAAPTYTPIPGGFVFMDTEAGTYGGAPQAFTDSIDNSSTSPRLSANYLINSDMMVFATYATGFKSGGFNARATSPLMWTPYDDTDLTSLEAGIKTDLLENTLRINFTAYTQDIEDAQVQVNAVDPNGQGGFSTMIQNAGQATINGFELEVIAKPINDIIINFGYGYTDASYDDYISVSPITGLPADVADDRGFEFTPDDNYNLSISYVLPLNLPTGDITERLNISRQDDIIFTPKISGNEDIAQDSYELINLRIAYEEVKAGDGTFTVALWGRNLADEEYKIGGFEIDAGDPAFGGLGRAAISQWGAPRTYGIDLIYAMGD